ncbi:cell division protein ZapE [Pseudomonas defluvii]|uniref:cell division protein ZapE n=1 Tax=Pseudomonas defluvii TaxID=1876757 RepID=UPI0009F70ADB|nr:cell division protein ZapE [Pseudomonas defluvii]
MTAKPPSSSWIRSPLRSLRQRMQRGSTLNDGPAQQLRLWFQHKAHEQGYTLSHSQQQVIGFMAGQVEQLARGQARSLYLYGGVGRGKSWLLEGFFRAITLEQKRRLHFHDFFARLHDGMFRHRHADNALACTLDELLEDCKVLCFDEFHVHDIGDAMLITQLFKALFERRILLLVTSNYPPEGLLPNPLYHQRFEPVIRLIKQHMHVVEVGGEDYRGLPGSGSHQRFTQGCYLWPGNAEQRAALDLPSAQPTALAVGKRDVQAWLVDGERVAFDFAALCEQPTAVIDYLQLAQRFEHWVIDGLPNLADCSIAAQQRFINLIDVLYDQDKYLVLIGEQPLDAALQGTANDLARTRSRLGQLQQIAQG